MTGHSASTSVGIRFIVNCNVNEILINRILERKTADKLTYYNMNVFFINVLSNLVTVEIVVCEHKLVVRVLFDHSQNLWQGFILNVNHNCF